MQFLFIIDIWVIYADIKDIIENLVISAREETKDIVELQITIREQWKEWRDKPLEKNHTFKYGKQSMKHTRKIKLNS